LGPYFSIGSKIHALAIEEPIQVLLVEGSVLSGSICYGDSVLRAAFAILVLGQLEPVVVLVGVVPSAVGALTIIVMWLGTVVGVAVVLVVAVGFLGVLHVGMLVDHRHHLGDHLRVALEDLALELDVVQPLVEVLDDIPITTSIIML
jgi:hypothetical protein